MKSKKRKNRDEEEREAERSGDNRRYVREGEKETER